ncbi:tetratricopeptide repeat protein [Algisphaera agarilytica]|uniref:Tetratricopeptide (TPR) repeat protein n=1 Tax=Algisphaera agarilytica TaxID=1385975 RepID=A0A7X0H5T9_9BACT|nr:tetratricopeptide repeat protein [Algisphaera agarilytica]MBB6429673.1 tetratricopeptide (TPR) repeat protein [Algisphaera agarilytica]
MKRNLLILAAAAALLLLMFGIYRSTLPTSALLSPEEAQTQLEDLAARFSAAIENERDVQPLLEPVDKIVAQQPGLRDGQKLLGQIHAQLGDIQPAYDAFAAALMIDPNEAHLQNLAGTAAMMLDDVTAAETHHRLAAQQSPDDPVLLVPLADVLLKTQRWDEARNILLRVLELDSTLHQPHAALSDVYAGRGEEGDDVRAIDQMEKALSKLPLTAEWAEQRVVYARKLARLFSERDEPMEAIAVLDSLSPEARFSPDVLRETAEYLEANGQVVLAGLQYEMALKARPTEADYAAESALWYLKGGDRGAAQSMMERLESIDPRHMTLEVLRTRFNVESVAPGPGTDAE